MTDTNRKEIKEKIEKNYKFNSRMSILDGAFYTLGMGFISTGTILPLFVRQLTKSNFLISMVTAILMFSTTVPQLLSAKWTADLDKKKKKVLSFGLFQRLPWLGLAILTFILGAKYKSWLLIGFFLLWTIHNLFGGLVGPVWFDLVAKVIPQDRRGKFFGYRTFISSVLEVLGALGAGYIINQFDFRVSFTILFFLTFLAMMGSYIFLALTKEPAYPVDSKTDNFKDYFTQLFLILKEKINYRNFLIGGILIQFIGMANGLFTVAGIERLGLEIDKADNIVGAFTVILIVSKSLTNIFWGYFGDKYGHKLVILIASIFNAVGVLVAFFAQKLIFFYLVFVLTGIALGGTSVSFMTIIADFASSPEERTIYVGLTNAVVGIVVTIISLLGGFLADILNYKVVFGISFLMISLGVIFLFLKVSDPRISNEGN
ncbi:arabinose efflux permease family protein [Halobacteroides halobius DSM 5150]|uniref:Arabinose efflux permease family protein n=1 Tax=Halobacteroides halobius (strain ATCC 35273 / DSM 5150 / MD-1) TaxID=748449 RepID=L0KA73_HALHC|nr:MFS transporter [Halobacteroides halobius]AGB41269.1 arabinose efflux permease family protein [Halobacteroides halobius DSM 5150]